MQYFGIFLVESPLSDTHCPMWAWISKKHKQGDQWSAFLFIFVQAVKLSPKDTTYGHQTETDQTSIVFEYSQYENRSMSAGRHRCLVFKLLLWFQKFKQTKWLCLHCNEAQKKCAPYSTPNATSRKACLALRKVGFSCESLHKSHGPWYKVSPGVMRQSCPYTSYYQWNEKPSQLRIGLPEYVTACMSVWYTLKTNGFFSLQKKKNVWLIGILSKLAFICSFLFPNPLFCWFFVQFIIYRRRENKMRDREGFTNNELFVFLTKLK